MRLLRRCPKCNHDCGNDKKTGKLLESCSACGVGLAKQVWRIDYYVEGIRKCEVVGTNKRFAEEVMAKRKVQLKEGRFFDIKKEKCHSLKEVASDFLDYSKNNKKSYWRDVIIVNHLLNFFKDKRLEHITPVFIERYKAKRLNDDRRKPATVNREIACLKCIFNWAIKNGKADVNPMRQVKLLKENNTRLRFLSQEEIVQLKNNCPERIQQIVETALMTGMRRGEILNLKKEDVNLRQNIIVIKNSKSGKLREIPICSALRKIIVECLNSSKNEYVFCSKLGLPYKNFSTGFKRIIKNSGIKDFSFHDLRHTAASYLVMAGIDIVTVKDILGHSSINMTLRYTHLSPVHKREAMEVLGSQMDTFWTPTVPDMENRNINISENILYNQTDVR